jgi:phosphonate transport system substrate-binding protein
MAAELRKEARRVRGFRFRSTACAAAFLCAGVLLSRSQAVEPTPSPFRMGVSYASFGTVSRNDASAALKAWASTVLMERGLTVDGQTEVFDQVEDLRGALAREQVDAATMSAAEFVQEEPQVDAIYLTAKGQTFTEQYVLLVHRAGGLDDVAALKGRKLVQHSSPRTGLALPWLETLLAGRNLGPANESLGQLTTVENPSKAVLRVFFRQTDACLVTSNAFGLACELNPQVQRELRILATSPPVVPTLMFFRPSYRGAVRQQVEEPIQDLHSTVAGRQVLTVFQGDKMMKQPTTCLEATRQLLAEHGRLRRPADPATPRPSSPGVSANTTP